MAFTRQTLIRISNQCYHISVNFVIMPWWYGINSHMLYGFGESKFVHNMVKNTEYVVHIPFFTASEL